MRWRWCVVGFIGGLVNAGMLGWDLISTGPHRRRVTRTPRFTEPMRRARQIETQSSGIRARKHFCEPNITKTHLCAFCKAPKNTWKTKHFPELADEISEGWRDVLMNAGLNPQVRGVRLNASVFNCVVAKICIQM